MAHERRRRTVLRLAGSAALAGLVGCIGGDGSGDSGDTTRTAADETTSMTTGDEARTTPADTEATTGTRTATARTETTPATDDDETTTTTTPTETATRTSTERATTTGAPDLSGPVPSVYRTATSQGGTDRNPDSLQSKDAVEYQSRPKDNEQCSGCLFYIADKNGDGLGTCSVVEGYIEPKAWCVSYSPYQVG
jgi:hypothetical protein